MKKVIELKVKVYLLTDLHYNESLGSISKILDNCFLNNDKRKEFHFANKFKNYCFDMMYPLEVNKIYKEGNVYTFTIRTVDEDLANYLKDILYVAYTDAMKVLTIEKKIIQKRHITDVYNLTPLIAKFNEGYWGDHTTIQELERRIKDNLIKKYNQFYNTKIDEDFELFNMIHMKNKLPIATNYKDIKILGDKFNIAVADNSTAQSLIYFALGVGLGEMNARGFGFINYKSL